MEPREERNRDRHQEAEPVQREQGKDKPALAAGERVFAVLLLLTGLGAFGLALELWFRMSEPRIASAAALPLFVSGLWVVMALLIVAESFRQDTPLSGRSSLKEKLRAGLRYALPREVLVMLAAILAYCALLLVGVSFYVVTALFLFGTMCYLTGKDVLKHILWTGVIMVFIVLVFRVLFQVIFP